MFELAQPWVLILLPLPFILWFILPRAPQALPTALKVPFYDAMSTIAVQEKPAFLRKSTSVLFLLIWLFALFAAAGPRWIGQPIPVERQGRNLMLALDLSGSMQLEDMQRGNHLVSRLSVVKQAAKSFVEQRVGDKIGLILFGSRAYLQTPLTYDRQTILLRIDDATVGLAGQQTAIGDALGLAVKRLQDIPTQGRVIILLTDGANNSGVLTPLDAAQFAKDDNIKVYTIGLGAVPYPGSLNDMFSRINPSADLDEKTLKKIAEMTGGQYFRATDPASLQTIYAKINALETHTEKEASIRPQKDYYPWPLALSLLLFFYWLLQKTGAFQKITRPLMEIIP